MSNNNNIFKQLPETNETAPPELGNKIIGSYSLFVNVIRTTDLFVGKLIESALQAIRIATAPPLPPITQNEETTEKTTNTTHPTETK